MAALRGHTTELVSARRSAGRCNCFPAYHPSVFSLLLLEQETTVDGALDSFIDCERQDPICGTFQT